MLGDWAQSCGGITTEWLGRVITTPLGPECAGSFRGVLWCDLGAQILDEVSKIRF
jgi:hypothetical protein